MANRQRKRRVSLPGHVRCSLQLYQSDRRFYGQIPGRSLSRIRVNNAAELEALWKQIENVIDLALWRKTLEEPAEKRDELAAAGWK